MKYELRRGICIDPLHLSVILQPTLCPWHLFSVIMDGVTFSFIPTLLLLFSSLAVSAILNSCSIEYWGAQGTTRGKAVEGVDEEIVS